MKDNHISLSERQMGACLRILAELAPDTTALSSTFVAEMARDYSCFLQQNQAIVSSIVREPCQGPAFGTKGWD